LRLIRRCRIGFHGSHQRGLPLRTTTALATPAPAAPIGIIDLYRARQWTFSFSLQHDLHQFVFHQPGAVLGDAQLAGQSQGGEAVLRLGDQIHGQKPGGQPQLGTGEDRSGGHRGLATTSAALVQTPALELARFGAAAFRTDKAAPPAPGKQGALALGLCSVLFHEFRQTHASLKLNPVFQHRCAPCGINDVSKAIQAHWLSLIGNQVPICDHAAFTEEFLLRGAS
jgi:hypothetical protein